MLVIRNMSAFVIRDLSGFIVLKGGLENETDKSVTGESNYEI